MERIVNLIFEAYMLKRIPRSGFQFLGAGDESVAEHVFITMFIAFVMAKMEPDTDCEKMLSMCLVHDLPEARMGDLNAVQKKYVTAHENRALAHLTEGLFFGEQISNLVDEFNAASTKEARLAVDADQLALIVSLKSLQDVGYSTPEKWMAHVSERLKTTTGIKIAEQLLQTDWDSWWLKEF